MEKCVFWFWGFLEGLGRVGGLQAYFFLGQIGNLDDEVLGRLDVRHYVFFREVETVAIVTCQPHVKQDLHGFRWR